jgi:hypothetical protein
MKIDSNGLDESILDSLEFLKKLCSRELLKDPIGFSCDIRNQNHSNRYMAQHFFKAKEIPYEQSFLQIGRSSEEVRVFLWFSGANPAFVPVIAIQKGKPAKVISSDLREFIRTLGSGAILLRGRWIHPDILESSELEWTMLRNTISNYIEDKQVPDEPKPDLSLLNNLRKL